MSQDNLEVVRRSIDAFSRGDLEGVLDGFAPEFEFHPSGRFMDTQQIYRGREGWGEFWAAWRAAWEEITISVERMTDLDDRVLTLGNFNLRGGGSGVEVHAEAAWLHTVKDGRIVHLRSFSTWNEALEAVGLRE
jgi:ketosteroid isomerase-like protein